MEERIDVLSFGEALIDFLPGQTGCRLRDVRSFSPRLGGAPANLAFGVARLGRSSALMTKLGADEFGHMARGLLEAVGVDVSAVVHTPEARTGLTFVQVDADGERSFLFYRSPSADMTFRAEDVDEAMVARSRVVNTGTNLMMTEATLAANLLLLDRARALGKLVTMDANVRVHLWADRGAIVPTVLDALERVDLLKVNDAEHRTLFGAGEPAEVFEATLAPRGVKAMVVTHGPQGATVVGRGGLRVSVPAPTVAVKDTTGAGDGFLAGLLCSLCRTFDRAGVEASRWPEALAALGEEDWRRSLQVACTVGASVCTEMGATAGLPPRGEVDWGESDLKDQEE